ncbi:MAG: hypothetical protein ACHQF4_01960 [Sphingobacteriales bacterium]
MLQNRVDPQGNIIATSARGSWMGNRGQLHDKGKTIKRPFKLKAWLICLLEFNGRHRQIMAPGRYTELFFLDEASAFAAGHRPCFECRRQDYNRFKAAWLKGNPKFGFNEKTSFIEIDQILHGERIDQKGNKITHDANIKDLPDGAFILIDGEPYLLTNNCIYHWMPTGYESAQALPESATVTVLTPKSTLNAFCAGYRPQVAI